MIDNTYGQLPPESSVWHFRARPDGSRHDLGVVDGDTLDVTADLGFRAYRDVRLRLYRVDTAEIYGVHDTSDEYERGMAHARFVEEWLDDAVRADPDDHWPLRIYTLQDSGKYGRYVADVLGSEGDSLVAALFERFGDEVRSER
jgi:endonuclease YncB( thermonuclease family)